MSTSCPLITLRILIVCPVGVVRSPGCWPGLQAPTWRPSITDLDVACPPSGGSNVASASVRYDVSLVIVITDFDFIVEPPRLHTASPVNLLPLILSSLLLHRPAIMPDDILIMSCWTDASRHSVLFAFASGARFVDVVISHSPGLSLGKSCAATAGPAARTASVTAAISVVLIAGEMRIRSPSGRRIRSPASLRASSRRARASRIACCCFAGKRRARLTRNFSISTGMPSLRRRLWPIGYSTTTSFVLACRP